jgi:putative DNA methylase
MNGIINSNTSAYSKSFATKVFNYDSKLCVWDKLREGGQHTFLNQALNTLNNYAVRASRYISGLINKEISFSEIKAQTLAENKLSKEISTTNDIYVTDPPYGDAVKYEEILEFFIAWLRKNPPKEFSNWVWDSRRALAIKGEGDEFKREMIAAYKSMREHSPDNGIHILMFTHQSGSIWAEMANIIWASGLRVTAAWYVVTETDSALRQGANVKGTIILVLRKRIEEESAFREDLAEDIEKEVRNQIQSMSGLDKEVQSQGAEALYNDADLQMAGYAAALKVLTRYSNIDGKDMVAEAEAPRVEGRKTFVDELIEFAVQLAVKFLVPVGFESDEWMKFSPIERYYFKMAEMESRGYKTLDNYQNFAKAYKVMNFSNVLSPTSKANSTRLALGIELKTQKMSGDPELSNTLLRPVLYAIYEASEQKEEENIDIVLEHLSENLTHEKYFSNRAIIVKIFQFLADKRKMVKPAKNYKVDVEANFADLLAESILNQRI